MDSTLPTAVVTGAAVRIGRAVALSLGGNGWRVVVHYGQSRAEAEEVVSEIRGAGGEAACVAADLLDPPAAAETIFGFTEEHFGTVSLLVNNAALFEGGALGETDAKTWERLFAVNLQAPHALCERFVKGLGEEGAGQIINLADWRGLKPDPARLAYSLTKHGLVALTQTLAVALAPRVRVNAIAPGPVLPLPGSPPGVFEAAVAASPLARAGGTRDVVEAVQYLLSARLVTGEVLSVAGGAQLPSGRES